MKNILCECGHGAREHTDNWCRGDRITCKCDLDAHGVYEAHIARLEAELADYKRVAEAAQSMVDYTDMSWLLVERDALAAALDALKGKGQ